MKLKEQDFAQRRWKVLILESSHFLGFLPFVSCYISSKTANTKISVKTCKGILKRTGSAASSCFHLLPLPCSKAHAGDRLHVLHSGEDSRALFLLQCVCGVILSSCQLFISSRCLFLFPLLCPHALCALLCP